MSIEARTRRIWTAAGRQLRRPEGSFGTMIGRLMAFVNWKPYAMTIEALSVGETDRVLELGFGAGRSLATLCRLALRGKIVAIDHSEAMVAMAERRSKALISSGHLQLQAGRFSPLPFEAGVFDRVLLVNVIYFFDNSGNDIAECHRILKPRGRLAIYATDKATMEKWPFCEDETHRLFGRDDVVDLLVGAGFGEADIVISEADLPLGIRGLVVTATKR
jgi:ubiquinone/menaquinone biosynthesis C-methylase UbiE